MLTTAKIVDAEMEDHKGKQVARISLKLNHPVEVFVTTLWNNSVEKGEHKPFFHLVGQVVQVALRCEEFNGKVQYSIYTPFLPQPVKPAVKPASAA